MKKALLINGAKVFGHSNARLNATLQEEAKKFLENSGFECLQTFIDKGYEQEMEVLKILQSELIIYQMPAWWMGEPWIVKKYIDEVFMAGAGKLFKNDGRNSENPSKNYGKGGLCEGKKVMFSVTWNAPIEAFTAKDEFFEGLGVEIVYLHLRKAHEFIGMQVLPTFICNDVMKNPQIQSYIKAYKTHLAKNCL